MTIQSIFSPVQSAPLVNKDGTGTTQLLLFLNQLLGRVGGQTGGTYSKLTNTNGNILWDLGANPIAVVQLQSGSNILSIVSQVAGAAPYRITFIQPASGAAGTVVYPTSFVTPGGSTPTLSTGSNAVDLLSFVSDGTNMYLYTQGLNYLAI